MTSKCVQYTLCVEPSETSESSREGAITATTADQPPEEASPQFELEEYKQVLLERQFVMSRYMQAVGLYLALSGFALRELLDAKTEPRAYFLAILFSTLNIIAICVARQFRNMADHAMQREHYFAKRHHLAKAYQLFWGYRAGILLVGVNEVAIVLVTIFKIRGWPI